MTAPADTARLDQLRAAVRHAEAAVRTAAAYQGSEVHEGANIPWVRQQVAALFMAVVNKSARLCPHAGPDAAPQPLYASAWDPGRLTCAPCGLRLPRLTPKQDATCDRCHRIVKPIFPGGAHLGLVFLSWGLCRSCCQATGMPTRTGRGAA